jgi:hypothetical protein
MQRSIGSAGSGGSGGGKARVKMYARLLCPYLNCAGFTPGGRSGVPYKRVSRAARKNSSSTGVQSSKSVPPAR